MKQYINTLILILYISTSGFFLYGWNNEYWLGNCDRVVTWNGAQSADYLRLGVLKDGVYRVSADDIAVAMGVSTNTALAALNAGNYNLTCSTNFVAWTTDGSFLYFFGQKTESLYAPENVYFLRQASGLQMSSQPAPSDPQGGTNTWFMQNRSYRSDFLNVTTYFDRRSSNASIIDAPVFGMSLSSYQYCSGIYCEFTAPMPGYAKYAATNINLSVDAISYGDHGDVSDTHRFELFVEGSSCGTNSWSGEQQIISEFQAGLSVVSNEAPVLRVTNLESARNDQSEQILLLDVEACYPCYYEVAEEPLFCTGGSKTNIAVSGPNSDVAVMVWDITDPLAALRLDVPVLFGSNNWSSVFSCGDASKRYAVFETQNCFEPSVTGFKDINWNAAGAISSLVIVTPPRRWVSGFEDALQPLVQLRRAQGLGVRVVDAEDIYNAFSHGLVTPHAFQAFVNAGVNSGSKKLRYLLFAGYASTDYKLETFIPDTEFKDGKKGFPALFPLLQVLQVEASEYSMLLLPNDMMLGDADSNGIPDVAVGRFLATDSTELSHMVAKTVNHDLNHPWNRAVLVSDWNDYDGHFSNFSGATTAFSDDLSSGGWNTDVYHCTSDIGFGPIWDYMYDVDALDNLQDGRDLFYYLGHSSDTLMGHSSADHKYILNNSRLSSADWSYAPFAMCLGCRMGRYTSLDVVNLSTCIMEVAMKNPSSAFSGSISAAGYLTYGDAKALTELISDEINLYGAKRIGDAWSATLDQYGSGNLADIQHVVFLGDPSMPVYKPRYPTIFKLR
ncbi:MAG: C25 family cysteine peptidase [Kiritimatiellae bacterium]|nr:C25 family cysteine peptidase [Kiritimatiellia bacterium]